MEVVAAVIVGTVVAGATVARWSRLHPLVVGLLAGLAGAALGVLATAGLVGTNPWPFGAVALIVLGPVGALGAFIGWLRRKHIERMT